MAEKGVVGGAAREVVANAVRARRTEVVVGNCILRVGSGLFGKVERFRVLSVGESYCEVDRVE